MDSTLLLHWESLNGLRRLAIHKVRNNLSMLRVDGEQQAIDLGYDGIVPGTAGTAREDHHPLETKPKYEPQTHGPVCPEAVHDSSFAKRGGGQTGPCVCGSYLGLASLPPHSARICDHTDPS